MSLYSSVLSAEGDGPKLPSIGEFLPEPFLFQGTFFAINRLDLIRFVVTAFMVVLFCIIASRSHKRAISGNYIPTKPQSVVEMVFEFVRNLVYDNLGKEAGKKWLPMATTIFCAIFFFNITGIIPGLNIAASAGIGIPLLFGVWVFTAYWREGIKDHGGGIVGVFNFLKAELFPPGLPFYVYPIYALIEFMQLLVIRPVSLAIRLFANMMAGHILLGLCFAFTQFFVFVAVPALKAIGLITFAFAGFLMLFEVLVAVLQAYIFTLLACAYISMSFNHTETEH
jgi:F-type H+-transporting ATPase subunit a